MADYSNITPMSPEERAMTARMSEKCPTCGLGWWLFPPVRINGAPKVRCIECKDVFDALLASNPVYSL